MLRVPSRTSLVALAILALLPAFARAADAPTTKPYLLVQAWYDRPHVSDLYAFDFDGKLLRRLTREPLPACSMAAVCPETGDVAFVANASALYCLAVRHNILIALNAGDVGPVAISQRGEAAAFVVGAFDRTADPSRRVRVRPLVAGSPVKRCEVPLNADQDPSDLAFSPDATQLLITTWIGSRAQVSICDLATRKLRPILADANLSYCQPTFSPDGKTVLAVRTDPAAREWSIVAHALATGDVTILRTAPRGRPLSVPIYTADGKLIVFAQDSALARMNADGQAVEPLVGQLDPTPHPDHIDGVRKLSVDKGVRATRGPGTPPFVTRHLVHFEWENDAARVSVIDVRAKTVKLIQLPKGRVLRAAVVE